MLFFISFFMVLLSSYLFASTVCANNEDKKPKGPCTPLIWYITMFAQVVVSFEFLSLFKAIKEPNVLIINVLFLIAAILFWNKNKRPLYIPKIKETLQKITKALKRDKFLAIMAAGFVFMIVCTILLNLFLPVVGGDALSYHLNRASYWLHQGSLNHFTICDDRNLVMPINSEILYLWNLLFFKNDYGLYFVAFSGMITSLFCVYNILEYFNFSERRKVWSVLILSAFASVMGQATSLETDVFIGGIILASITLFLFALKEKNIVFLFFSSLAYALAMGTKSPAIIAFPGVFLLMTYFAYRKCKKEAYKPLITFLGFLALNFIIFSSYNYVLNFIDFGDPLGSESSKAIHGFRGGIKAFVANYIRYIFMMFDFSGFRYSDYVGEHITNARQAILTFLHIPADLGVEMADNNEVNNRLLNVKMGTGLLGFLLFLPSAVTAIILGIIRKTNKKINALFAFGAMFFINIAFLSCTIAYMVFSVRFLTFLVVLSSPVLALSYLKKNSIIKLLILFFAMSYFLVMSTNMTGRGFGSIAKVILEEKTLNDARERIRDSMYVGFEGTRQFVYIRDFIKSTPKGTSFAVFPAITEMYPIDMLNSHGWKVDTLLPEKAEQYDYSKYDYVVTMDKILVSTVLLKKTKDMVVEYKVNEKGDAYYPSYRPFTCVYELHGSGFYTNGTKGRTIMDSRCFIDIPFFEQRGFRAEKGFNLVADNPRDSHFMTIYKNMKK